MIRPEILSVFLSLLLLLFVPTGHAQLDGIDYNWKQKRDRDGITIYTSKVQDSRHKAILGRMTVNGSASSLVALVQDSDACPSWADLCKESRIHERISDREYYVYNYNDVPFPVKDRDALTHVFWQQDPETLRVTMTSKAITGVIPKTKAVRIEQALSQWHFTPQSDGTTLVELFAHIDPNGPTPAWLSNMLLVSSPFKTMTNMRKVIESGAYNDSKIAFLKSSTN